MKHIVSIILLLVFTSPAVATATPPQAYNLYIPFSTHTHNIAKGLAMADPHHPEDRAALNISWWYGWYWDTAPGFVPMVREMQMPPTCEPYILVGNEPDSIEPYGHPVTPQDAAEIVEEIENVCPGSRLVVGNVTQDGEAWLTSFLQEYKTATGHVYANGLGVHCYQWSAGMCVEKLSRLRALYNGEMWVTEFNDFSGDVAEFNRLLDYIAATFTRYAVFTNRQLSGPGFLHGPIVNDDGTLTPRGLVYSER